MARILQGTCVAGGVVTDGYMIEGVEELGICETLNESRPASDIELGRDFDGFAAGVKNWLNGLPCCLSRNSLTMVV